MGQKVLIINPDPLISQKLREAFEAVGFLLTHTNDLQEGLQLITKIEPTIVILDLDFPSFQAFDFCRTLRMQQENWTPLILLSEKDEEVDLVLGLELGADDYIRKPVRAKELVAKCKSILRRQQISWAKMKKESSEKIINGSLMIAPYSFTTTVNDEAVQLTTKEFELLLYLAQNIGKAQTREELLSVIGDEQLGGDLRIIDVFISRIREKIEPCRHKPLFIKTVRGIGYMMAPVKTYVK